MKAPTAEIGVAYAGDLLELTKPRITLMVVLTTGVGLLVAGSSELWGAEALLALATLLGTWLMAASASALNMWLERDRDRLMRRTEMRPLAAGRLDPDQALAFGVLLGAGGAVLLAMLANPLTALLGLVTLGLYLFAYTPLKLRTPWSTVVGAVPGAIPPMMGWTALQNDLTTPAWLLFAILFFWQMPHFYAIAWLCREDYRRAGFRMVSIDDPHGTRTARQMMLWTLLLVAASMAPLPFGFAGPAFVVVAALLGVGFLLAAFSFLRRRCDRTARRVLLFSVAYLPLCLMALVADRLA